ncbi:hypothetical protein B0I35DRAFT_396413 [Stachybotrys elegans]|uniref:tRNA(Ile)-lysidine synthetase n=1 Tax=Stachybotrys elegans TaxID=80388 RepID=A0A8K0WN95_9HYPO|nr:hypothetical protein B0I35DRAFT_396413 [Stachybotrys elegans]
MGPHAQFLHHVPKPISYVEFRDALLATCKPRFPHARALRPRPVALAVSGGADSMAMALLFSKYASSLRYVKIADNPIGNVHAFVVDHKLREGSDVEACTVMRNLRSLGLRPFLRTINWAKATQNNPDLSTAGNIESMARALRYQSLGVACRGQGATGLFVAHHRDDQYETILMRLLSGHRYRGLQGIREANPIPECYNMHGVYQSGILNDAASASPYLTFAPRREEIKALRRIFIYEQPIDERFKPPFLIKRAEPFPENVFRSFNPDPNVPYVTPLDTEDGGVTVYRPLLQFDKDRLVATCEADNVPWVEDASNHDPTYTVRNAVRHLVQNHELPVALQKPAILALSSRAKKRVENEEAEAARLISVHNVIKDFDPNVGTLLVQLPTFQPVPIGRRTHFTATREATRKPHHRIIAANMVRKLLQFVTPDASLPAVSELDNVVNRLFPRLAPESSTRQHKAFSMAGVLFDPVTTPTSTKWFLSRAPYPSNRPLPSMYISRWYPGLVSWKHPRLWDGRFWCNLSVCVHGRITIAPLRPECTKAFRSALPEKERTRLDRVLKYYAPGKTRFVLPAIYAMEDAPDGSQKQISTVLALPTLGFRVPGMERWVKYDVRYRKVDTSLLAACKTRSTRLAGATYKRPPSAFQRRRYERMNSYRRRKLDV